jgi:hypothetical protein
MAIEIALQLGSGSPPVPLDGAIDRTKSPVLARRALIEEKRFFAKRNGDSTNSQQQDKQLVIKVADIGFRKPHLEPHLGALESAVRFLHDGDRMIFDKSRISIDHQVDMARISQVLEWWPEPLRPFFTCLAPRIQRPEQPAVGPPLYWGDWQRTREAVGVFYISRMFGNQALMREKIGFVLGRWRGDDADTFYEIMKDLKGMAACFSA